MIAARPVLDEATATIECFQASLAADWGNHEPEQNLTATRGSDVSNDVQEWIKIVTKKPWPRQCCSPKQIGLGRNRSRTKKNMKNNDLLDQKFTCFCSPCCGPLYHHTVVACDDRRKCRIVLLEERHSSRLRNESLASCSHRAQRKQNAAPRSLDASSVNLFLHLITNPRLVHKLVFLCFPNHRRVLTSSKDSK